MTYVSSGCCPYNDKCVFLHDPEIKIDGIRLKPATRNSKTSTSLVKDSWYWPDMDHDEVFCTLDVFGLPSANQCYHIPSNFRYQTRHDQTLLSLWAHFVDECKRAHAHRNHSSTESSSVEPDSTVLVNPYLGVNRRRLPIFVLLSNSPQVSQKLARRVSACPTPAPAPTASDMEYNHMIFDSVRHRDDLPVPPSSMRRASGLCVKTMWGPTTATTNASSRSSTMLTHSMDYSPRGVYDLHTPSPLPSDPLPSDPLLYEQQNYLMGTEYPVWNTQSQSQSSRKAGYQLTSHNYQPRSMNAEYLSSSSSLFDSVAASSGIPDVGSASYASIWPLPSAATVVSVKTTRSRYE